MAYDDSLLKQKPRKTTSYSSTTLPYIQKVPIPSVWTIPRTSPQTTSQNVWLCEKPTAQIMRSVAKAHLDLHFISSLGPAESRPKNIGLHCGGRNWRENYNFMNTAYLWAQSGGSPWNPQSTIVTLSRLGRSAIKCPQKMIFISA
jgi:hypothetical protein